MKTNFIVALATVSLMSGAVIAQEANRPAGEPPRGDAKPGPPPPEQVRRPDGAKPEQRRETPPAIGAHATKNALVVATKIANTTAHLEPKEDAPHKHPPAKKSGCTTFTKP